MLCTSLLGICKLLQDDSACYWLTSHFMSFLCASIQLFSHPSGILTPCISSPFALRCTRQTGTQEFTMYHQFTSPFSRAQTLLQATQRCSTNLSHPQRHRRQQEQCLPPQISMSSLWNREVSHQPSPDTWDILVDEPPCNASSICFWRAGPGLPAQRGFVCTHRVGN